MPKTAELARFGKFLQKIEPVQAQFCDLITAHYLIFVKVVKRELAGSGKFRRLWLVKT
jgi:hypothetical protein